MNLHALAKGAVGAVNPAIIGQVLQSTGSTLNADGSRNPLYNIFNDVEMQVQPLSTRELQLAEMLNLQGTLRGVYLFGDVEGIVRANLKGGDLLAIQTGINKGVWLVNSVLESWPNWCKVACILQVDVLPAIALFRHSYKFNDRRNSGYPLCF